MCSDLVGRLTRDTLDSVAKTDRGRRLHTYWFIGDNCQLVKHANSWPCLQLGCLRCRFAVPFFENMFGNDMIGWC